MKSISSSTNATNSGIYNSHYAEQMKKLKKVSGAEFIELAKRVRESFEEQKRYDSKNEHEYFIDPS